MRQQAHCNGLAMPLQPRAAMRAAGPAARVLFPGGVCCPMDVPIQPLGAYGASCRVLGCPAQPRAVSLFVCFLQHRILNPACKDACSLRGRGSRVKEHKAHKAQPCCTHPAATTHLSVPDANSRPRVITLSPALLTQRATCFLMPHRQQPPPCHQHHPASCAQRHLANAASTPG